MALGRRVRIGQGVWLGGAGAKRSVQKVVGPSTTWL
jgi:uncharacterized protein YaaW (UPF0174 family)